MKKIFTLFVSAVLVTGSAFAQSHWLNYGNSVNTWKGTTGIKSTQLLFPDTLVHAFENNSHTFMPYVYAGYSKIEFHQLGNVLDVLSPAFSNANGVTWNSNTSYMVDSMGVEYQYVRKHPDNTIVDTLIVYLYNNHTAADLPTLFFTGAFYNTNYNVDTMFILQQQYNYISNEPVALSMITVKVPLTVNDSSSAITTKYFSTPVLNVNAGKQVACAISFKPGYSYVNGDTITSDKNYFSFVSTEEKGSNTYPTYTKRDGNLSSLIMPYQRYNYDPGFGINGVYMDSYFWASMWQFEHHMIYYHVTSTSTINVNEEIADNGVKLFQNRPNPFNKTSLIGYELEKPSDVLIEVHDITGRKVSTFNKGKQDKGYHNITIDASLISKGVYFYTLKTDGVSLMRKMIITE